MTRLLYTLALVAGLAEAIDAHAAAKLHFESANLNIYVGVTVAHSQPMWFLLDTGVKPAIIDLGVARALALPLGDSVAIVGGGKDSVTGYLLKGSPYNVVGLAGFNAPLFLAMPLNDLSRRSGRQIAGILGYDFISQFVVEIDYVHSTITLQEKNAWTYRGKGAVFPITFNAAFHPQVRAQVIDHGKPLTEGTFVFDLGSGATVIFNRPFVEEQHFLQGERRTVNWMEGRGIGGQIAGSVGRVEGLKLGPFLIRNPVAVFARAESGPFASAEAQGNIGAAIIEKFNVILDYERKRIILEPNERFGEPLDYNRAGLSLTTADSSYRDYSIDAIAEGSSADSTGLHVGDTLVAIDGHPAAEFTLSEIRLRFRHAKTCRLTVQRGNQRLEVGLSLHSPI